MGASRQESSRYQHGDGISSEESQKLLWIGIRHATQRRTILVPKFALNLGTLPVIRTMDSPGDDGHSARNHHARHCRDTHRDPEVPRWLPGRRHRPAISTNVLAGKSISLARWVEAAVFLKFLENLPSLAVGHESGQYLPQAVFFCGRLVREEDQLLKLHPTMNGF